MQDRLEKKPQQSIQNLVETINLSSIEQLDGLELLIPENFLSRSDWKLDVHNNIIPNFRPLYRYLDHEKIQWCVANGASIKEIDLDSPGVLKCPEIVERLIQLNKNIHAPVGSDHDSILHIAASYGPPETLKLLIDAGATIEAKNRAGMTPLHSAAGNVNYAAVEFLLKAGADIHAATQGDLTALHFATGSSEDGNADAAVAAAAVVKLLVAAGADVNARTNRRQTPLHHATEYRSSITNIKCAEILLYAGANPDLRDYKNRTALESLRTEDPEVIKAWRDAFKEVTTRIISRNSMLFAQGYRDKTSLFAKFPEGILCKIATYYPDRIEEEGEDYRTALYNFGMRPGQK